MNDLTNNHNQDEQPPPHHYGTFQGVNTNPPPSAPPVIGFPPPSVNSYVHGYQPVTGYAIAEGRPVRARRLPCCCGIGMGWCLFIIGFFLAAIPWYVGAFILLCARYDRREKPGYIACLIAAILGTIVVLFGVTNDDWDWDWDW
ncbi:hypothetical protein M8C21_009476 [Ambrosia artemisiifolia]|uniref:60S ribosomal protein L18a-like protein n=1 Tax=Ambrosia artemisiifolia TaxID=4212 RepID=A0AAD5D9Q4_AMBAR|nr:hypothetical protein M8C21_009476 [Ambrosia artemisiifolia]